MISVIVNKSALNNSFTGINTRTLGYAAGQLKFCGLKLYLYLAGNRDGFKWVLNPTAYANWLGVDYAVNGRAVRKSLNDGIADLEAHGFLRKCGNDQYEFLEQNVPEK